MKNDLISRQVAIDKLETVGYDFSNSGLSEIELEEVCEAVGDVRQDMISMIKRLPSAQPEMSEYSAKLWKAAYERGKAEALDEIVRCKDCKYWTHIKRTNRYWCKTDDGLFDPNPSPDDFCSRAKRRTDDCV